MVTLFTASAIVGASVGSSAGPAAAFPRVIDSIATSIIEERRAEARLTRLARPPPPPERLGRRRVTLPSAAAAAAVSAAAVFCMMDFHRWIDPEGSVGSTCGTALSVLTGGLRRG